MSFALCTLMTFIYDDLQSVKGEKNYAKPEQENANDKKKSCRITLVWCRLQLYNQPQFNTKAWIIKSFFFATAWLQVKQVFNWCAVLCYFSLKRIDTSTIIHLISSDIVSIENADTTMPVTLNLRTVKPENVKLSDMQFFCFFLSVFFSPCHTTFHVHYKTDFSTFTKASPDNLNTKTIPFTINCVLCSIHCSIYATRNNFVFFRCYSRCLCSSLALAFESFVRKLNRPNLINESKCFGIAKVALQNLD